jgi:hypothetical protein
VVESGQQKLFDPRVPGDAAVGLDGFLIAVRIGHAEKV